jgi:hypothetical protein
MAPEAPPVKRWIQLGAVVVAIAAMVVAVVLLRSREEDQDVATGETGQTASGQENTATAEDVERIALLDTPRGEIDAVEIDRRGDVLRVYRNDQGIFVVDYPYDVYWNLPEVARVVTSGAGVASLRVIGEVEDLAEFGLDDPSAVVTIYGDGQPVQTLTIGAMNPARDGRYAMRDEDPVVYVAPNTTISRFFVRLDSLRLKQMPHITFEDLTLLEVDTLAGRPIRVELLPEWDRDPEFNLFRYAVTEPFERRCQVSTTWMDDVNVALQSLSIVRYVDDNPQNLAQYGLAPPRAGLLADDGETTVHLIVGDAVEDGRYAQFADGGSVFVLSGAEPIVGAEPFDVVGSFALILNIDLVDFYEIVASDERYVCTIERETVVLDGEEEVEETFFVNGTEIDEDPFRDLYQSAIGIRIDAEGGSLTGDPVVTITYHLNDGSGSRSVSLLDYDANYLSVVREGTAEFITTRAQANRLLRVYRAAVAEL